MPPDEWNTTPNTGNASESPEENDTRQRILAAAGSVFTKNGYSRATTKKIAKAAGISEVTLFRHFESKENLLKETMEAYGAPFIVRTIDSRLTGDYRKDMLMMGNVFVRTMMEKADTIRFVIGEAGHFPHISKLFSRMPAQMWRMLAQYLQKQMDAGVVRKLHPEAAAQTFFGSIFVYCMCIQTFDLQPQPEISAQEAMEQVVDIFVEGTIAR